MEGYSPWDTRELDKTEPLILPLSFTTIKMLLLRSPMTDVKMAVRADCVFLHKTAHSLSGPAPPTDTCGKYLPADHPGLLQGGQRASDLVK